MSGFQAISIYNNAALGASAVAVPVPDKVKDSSGNSPADNSSDTNGITIANTVRVVNTHATQLVYCKWNGTATATDYNFIVDGDSSVKQAVPLLATYLSVIASGSSTPIAVEWGTEL